MFSLSKLIFASSLIFSFSAMAQSEKEILEDILDLARQIRTAAPVSSASAKNLIEARILLEDALDLIESEGGFDQKCFQFAFDKYLTSTSTSMATDKAAAACKIIADLNVTQFAFEKYLSSTSTTNAMDKARDASGLPSKGKLEMIKFAFEKYLSSTSTTNALDKAIAGVADVPRGNLQCVKDLFSKYLSSTSTSNAMDKALDSCQ